MKNEDERTSKQLFKAENSISDFSDNVKFHNDDLAKVNEID